MKNKILAVFIMVSILCGVGIASYAAEAVAADGGGTHTTHSYTVKNTSSDYLKSSATCKELAKYYYSCSCGKSASYLTFESGSYAAHTGGSLGDTYDATYHYKKCSVCGKSYGGQTHTGGNWYDGNDGMHYKDCTVCDQNRVSHGSHSGGDWYDGGDGKHYKDCAHCTKKKYTNESHDSNLKLPTEDGNNTYKDTNHNTYCKACYEGKNKGTLTNKGVEAHTDWQHGEEGVDGVHQCSECEHEMLTKEKKYHYYSELTNGCTIGHIGYRSCLLEGCGVKVDLRHGTLYGLEGLPLEKYVASDAKIAMDAVPVLENGKYTLEWQTTDGNLATLRDANGNVITNLPKLDREWFKIFGWGRKTLKTHVGLAEGYAQDLVDQLAAEYRGHLASDYAAEELAKFTNEEIITIMINKASESVIDEWDNTLSNKAYEAVKNGAVYYPENVDNIDTNGKNTYYIDYQHEDGGWMFAMNVFNVSQSSRWYSDLFVLGEYDEEDPEPWYANIYYCYRTMDNQVPKNGFQYRYTYKTVKVYEAGDISVTETIYPDMNLINKAGYRYKGVTTQVSSLANIGPASAPPKSSATSGTVTVSWPYNQAAAMVTFFVEPVKLSYGHKATDYNKNIIDIVASNNQGSDLEFPDYYSESEGKCVISLNSLNKYWWPGYILESAKAYKAGTQSIISGSEKTYNDNTTTSLDDSSRYVVTEKVPSFYSSETKGFASDKEFYFFYNTPTIEIEHIKYGNGDYMQTTSGTAIKYIKYLQQIINEFAYIDSLITDSVKPSYTLNVSTATGAIESFTYSYPNHDLVQIKIYEVKDNGSTVHYATLYEDEKYKQGSKCYHVGNYAGVFADYYSESLNAIAQQIGQSGKAFNTNKNWKVEFIYDEVERVYIKFKDLKGNSIFIPDPDNPGKYIGEITAKIPESGYTYTPQNLGDNGRFAVVKYTKNEDSYLNDLSRASDINAGTPVSVPGNDGNWYIIFYYSTGKTLTIEYRDEKENTIRPSKVVEIPTTGAVVQVPKIDLFIIEGYKHNPNYDGKGHLLTKPTGEVITNSAGVQVYGINDIMRPLTIDDKEISIPNPNETNHHVIIYYKSTEALKIECREEGTEKMLQPPPEYKTPTWVEIPELGTKVQVPTIAAYKARYYLKNENYNGVDTTIAGNSISTAEGINVPITSNGNNQFLLMYYKKIAETSNLIVEYREGDPTGPYVRDPSTIELPIGEETPINVPAVEEYEVEYYIIITDPAPTPVPTEEGNKINITGNEDIPEQKIIIVYRKPDTSVPSGDPTIITPDDNVERVYLKANKKNQEEYDTEAAITTSEDLYVSGDVYAYRFVTEMNKKDITENVKVEIHQPYYTDLDTGAKDSISVNVTVPLTYKYYEIVKAELYDLKALHLENEAIKYYNNYDYDTNTYGTYKEGEANFPVSDQVPTLEYHLPTGIGNGTNNNLRVQINSAPGYTVTYKAATDTYVITITDTEYYEAINKTALQNQLKSEAMAILEKCTKIKVQTLKVKLPGEDDVIILTGEKYDLPNKSEALESPVYYIPYVAGRTPLESFFYNKDLYVREEAENRNHITTMTGDYRLVEKILDSNSTTITSYNPATEKLFVEAINVNSLNVHTPIVNDVKLELSAQNKEATQANINIVNSMDTNDITILNLEEEFTITIANSGSHINNTGYGSGRLYNHGGLTVGQAEEDSSTTSRITPKSNDTLMTAGIIVNTSTGAVVDKTKLDVNYDSAGNYVDEKDVIGPSYAEYKLIKFPYDVYLKNTTKGGSYLFKANNWYNLYEYMKPSITNYTFVIPTWVEDAKAYKTSENEGIHVLVVAENCSLTTLETAMSNPMGVKTASNNAVGKNNTYVLRTSFDTYVSGRLYDLQVRDADDPGYMGKITSALDGNDVFGDSNANEMPVAQKGQVPAYNMGMKLGYRIYFDLKTKGISNKEINLTPKIYYVSPTGAINSDISLFYHSKGSMYNKLTEKDLTVKMSLASSHGTAGGNAIYTAEKIAAKQLAPTRVFTNQTVIGKLVDGLTLTSDTVKLPFDNLSILATVTGLGTVDALKTSAIGNAKTGSVVIMNENMIKDCSGHWYGEYYLPASTIVVRGAGATKEQAMVASNVLTNGYLVVVFEEITTESADGNYLTYSAPTTTGLRSQWEKEGIDTIITLPNGTTNVQIPTGNGAEAAPVAIYQVGLRANNDFETEGTH